MNNIISLRPMDLSLLHEYYKGFIMDADIFIDMSLFSNYEYSPEKVEAYFKRLKQKTNRIDFLIMNGETPIGELALKNIDMDTKECVLSIHLQNDEVKNKGYGTEAERQAIDYAFNVLGVNSVLADSIVKNKRSQRVLEKAGFIKMNQDNDFVYYRIDKKV